MTNSSRFFYMKGSLKIRPIVLAENSLGGWLGVKGVAWGPLYIG